MTCLEDYEAWAETVYLLRSPRCPNIETIKFLIKFKFKTSNYPSNMRHFTIQP
jgi:hypothetical protein